MMQTQFKAHPDWLVGISLEEKEEFLKELRNFSNSRVAKVMRAMMQRKLDAEQAAEASSDYAEASWSHKQAHRNGKKEFLIWMDNILSVR